MANEYIQKTRVDLCNALAIYFADSEALLSEEAEKRIMKLVDEELQVAPGMDSFVAQSAESYIKESVQTRYEKIRRD